SAGATVLLGDFRLSYRAQDLVDPRPCHADLACNHRPDSRRRRRAVSQNSLMRTQDLAPRALTVRGMRVTGLRSAAGACDLALFSPLFFENVARGDHGFGIETG